VTSRILLLVAAASSLCFLRAADPPSGRAISLTTGTGELLEFDRDIVTLSISEPKIADAVVVSPHEVMVNAKAVGQTTLVVWETGALPARYNIKVVRDELESQALRTALETELKSALTGADIQFSGNAETVVLTGKAADAEQYKRAEAVASLYAKKVVNMLQMADPRQILLQVKFAAVNRTALSQFGFNLLSHNGAGLGETSTQQFQAPLFSPLQFQGNNLTGSNLNLSNLLNLFIFRPDLDIGATIQALESQNVLQILAEPNLLVMEGSEASFLAGGEFPFPTITATPTSGGIAPVVTVQFKKFGVQLNFTPTRAVSGAIHLKVKPEVSALDYTNAVTLQGFLIPALSSRVAETEVTLKDGESFAIAGLIDNQVTQILNKIPILGDIPILGQLFRSHSTQKSVDELMVVITPHLVKALPPGEMPKMPIFTVPFLPPPKEDVKKKKKSTKPDDKPAFVGPVGHEIPKQ
jgi:pilus assembly protein CpaC